MEAMHVIQCVNSPQQNILRCNSSRINNDVPSSSSSGCVQKYINTLAIVEAQQKRLSYHHAPISSLDSKYVLHDNDYVHTTISSAHLLQNYPNLSMPAIQVEETDRHQLETTNVHRSPVSSHKRTILETILLEMDAIQPDPSQSRSQNQNQEQATQSVLVENHPSYSTLISTSYFLNFLCKID
jgi:hypothetical protein